MPGLLPGTRLEKYTLERLLGSGGMGAVWLAHDEELDRDVALKVLRPSIAAKETARARLIREARAMARLRHPNVITVYDASSADGHDFVVMELVDGQNMASWLASAERSEEEIFHALVAAGRGLAAAHAAGMVHRDFKPHNILVERATGRILVTDFGLARTVENDDGTAETVSGSDLGDLDTPVADLGALDSPLTKTGHVIGTPAYMAPEQMAGRRADERADQFSFCVTAWEALSGKRPFPGHVTEQIAKAIDAQQPVGVDEVPRRLRAVLLRGMQREPQARWRSMDQLIRVLVRAWRRPRRRVIAAGVLAVAAVTTLGVYVATRGSSPAGKKSDCDPDALPPAWSAKQLGLAKDDPIVVDLERWTTQWKASFQANCARRTEPDFAARRLCLESQRDEVASFMTAVDAKVVESMRSTELPLALPSVESCERAPRAIVPPLPTAPVTRAKVIELRRSLWLLQIDAHPKADYEALAERANALVVDARASGDVAVETEALLTQALVRQLVLPGALGGEAPENDTGLYNAYREAIQLYAVAAERAEAIGYDRVRADAMLGQLYATVLLDERIDPIDDLLRRTELAIARLGDPHRELVLEFIRAEIAYGENQWSRTIGLAGRVRAGWQARHAHSSAARAALLEVAARELRHAGDDLDIAARILRETLATPAVLPAEREEITKAAARIALRRGEVRTVDAGDQVTGGPVEGSVVPVEAGTVDDKQAYTRRSMPTVTLADGKHSWTAPCDTRGNFAFANVPPGTYVLTAITSSSFNDLHAVRDTVEMATKSRVHATLRLQAPFGVKPLDMDDDEYLELGVVVALGGKAVAKTPAEFRKLFLAAPWFTVTHPESSVYAILAEPHVVCMAVGAVIDEAGQLKTDPSAVACSPGS